MFSPDVIESSGEVLKEDMLCAYLNDGREIKSRGLIKNRLPRFVPRMTHISSSDHLHAGEKDSSCWIRALVYSTCNASASKSQIVLVSKKQKLPKQAVIVTVLSTAAKFHRELYFTGLQF